MKKLIFAVSLFFTSINVLAYHTDLYFFYDKDCPHCKSEMEFLDSIKDNYDITYHFYEVTNDKDNSKLLKQVKTSFKLSSNYVPFTVIGDNTVTGFSETAKDRILKYLDMCSNYECTDNVFKIQNGQEIENKKDNDPKFNLPFLGEVDVRKTSIPLIAVILGLIDGFNPCAMWVLLFLISVLLNLKDSKRRWILGLTFLITSGIIYLFFMVAWLNVMISMSTVRIIRILIGLFALVFGIYSIYKFFTFKVGCSVTDKNEKKKIMNRIIKYTKEKSFVLAILGMIFLAISVNLVELACSVGLPVIFTNILAINDLSVLSYAFNLFIYILFYMMDDIIIFLIAMITLKVTGISNKYTKLSKIIGGVVMILIGILMLFFPSILMFNF